MKIIQSMYSNETIYIDCSYIDYFLYLNKFLYLLYLIVLYYCLFYFGGPKTKALKCASKESNGYR